MHSIPGTNTLKGQVAVCLQINCAASDSLPLLDAGCWVFVLLFALHIGFVDLGAPLGDMLGYRHENSRSRRSLHDMRHHNVFLCSSAYMPELGDEIKEICICGQQQQTVLLLCGVNAISGEADSSQIRLSC